MISENENRRSISEERADIIHQLLNFGEALLSDGAEVNRVEDTLTRLGRAYGAKKMSVFVITSSIEMTISFDGGEEITRSRRVPSTAKNDLSKLEELNALSRRCCENPIPIDELRGELKRIKNQYRSPWPEVIGSLVAAGSFAVFFGGSIRDGAAAAAAAVLIWLMQKYIIQFCMNQVVFNFVCSFISGLFICAVSRLVPGLDRNMIMIGDIMLLIPGIAMTNSVRDIMLGDTISGVMRFIESLTWAAALAFGFMTSIKLLGG